MYKKLITGVLLPVFLLATVASAASDIYLKSPNSEPDYRFSYDSSSVIQFLTTRLYCGTVYIFSSAACYESAPKIATPTTSVLGGNTISTPSIQGNTYTANPTNISTLPNETATVNVATAPASSPQRQTVYQVIERIIERAVPGPKGDKGDKGEQGAPGSTIVSGQSGQQVSGSGYYASYVSGAQYSAASQPNPIYTTVNTGAITSGSVQTNLLNATTSVSTGNLTASGTSNLSTTTISGTFSLGTVASGSAASPILVHGPNGEVQQISPSDLLASSTSNTVTYTDDASNTLVSTVNGVVSTTSINTLNNLNLTGTTTSQNIVNSGNIVTNFLSSIFASITNLLFGNATGTNITATGTAQLANVVATNTTSTNFSVTNATTTNIVGTNATFTNLTTSATITAPAVTTGSLTTTGTSTLAPTSINGALTLNPVASGSATSSLLVYGPNGEVQQVSPAALLASNTTNIINYTGDASNTLESTVNGVLSTTSIDTLINLKLTGTTTSENIENSGNIVTNFLSSVLASIANLLFGNATGTNITATGTASLANVVATNTLSTNIEGTNATLTNATSTNLFSTNASITNATISNLAVDSISVPNTLSSSANIMTSDVGGSVSTTTIINSNLLSYTSGELTSYVNGIVATTSLAGLVTADNGLTINPANNVQLGGTLIKDTTVDGQSLTMSFIKNRLFQALGNFVEIGQDGGNTFAGNGYQVAIGNANNLKNDYNTAIGDRNTLAGSQVIAIGYDNSLDSNNSYALGANNKGISGSKDNYYVGEGNDFSSAGGSHVNVFGSYNTGLGNLGEVGVYGFHNTVDGVNNGFVFGSNLYNKTSNTIDIGLNDSTKTTIDDFGRLTLRGSLNVTGTDGNTGELLVSQGAATMPSWQSPASILAGATTNVLGFATSTKVLTSTVNGIVATTSLNNTFWSLTGNAGTASTTNFLGTTDNMGLNFRTNNTNRMHITDSGNVGIGLVGVGGFDASVPNANKNLEIRSNTPTMRLSVTNYFAGGVYADIYRTTKGLFIDNYGANFTPSGDIRLRTHANGNIKLNPNELVGSGSGRVGINIAGDTAPVDMLELNSGIANDSGLTFTQMTSSTTGTTGAKPIGVTSAGKVVTIDNLLGLSTLAIGTTTVPSGKVATFQGDIDVSGTIDPTRILFSNLAGVNSPSYIPSANNNDYKIEFTEGGNLLFASASTSNIMRMMNDGKVGIGTNPTAGYVQIAPNTATTGLYINSAYNVPLLTLNTTAAAGNSIKITDASSANNGAIDITRTTSNALANSVNSGLYINGTYQHYGASGLGTGARISVTNNTATAGYTLYGASIDATANTAGNTVVGIRSNVSSTAGNAYAGIFTGGNVGIGTTTPAQRLTVYDGNSSYVQVISGNNGGYLSEVYNPAPNNSFQFITGRGNPSAKASVGVNDHLGRMMFFGYDGVANRIAAEIKSQVDATPGAGDMPGNLIFSTTKDGTASLVERMRVTNQGNVGIGTSTPGNALHIASSTIAKGVSGLRLGITNASTTKSATTTNRVLSVDANGDVIMASVPGTQNVVDFFVNANPNTAGTTFTPNQPQDGDVIYVSDMDNSTWIWDGTAYVTYTAPASTEWMLANSTTDAGSNKNSTIWRNGTLGIGTSTPNSIITGISTNTRPIITMGNTVNNTGNWSSMFAQTSTNTGTHSFVAGYQQNNTGPYSALFGRQASNTANYSLLAGLNSQNSSQYSVLIGNGLTNNIGSDGSALFGGTNNNSGVYSVLGGSANVNTASGDYSAMLGVSGYNEGSYSLIVGRLASNTSPYSVVVGNVNTNTGSNSFVGGSSNVNAGAQSILYGNNNQNAASGQYAYLFGVNASNTGLYSILAGYTLKNLGHYNAIFGSSNQLNTGNYNLFAGVNSSSTGSSNIIGGQSQENDGNYNIVSGYNNVNFAQGAAVLGYNLNNASHYTGIFGLSSAATGSYSLVSGYNNKLDGNYGLISGANHVITADQNIVGGNSNIVTGIGNIVMGFSHEATGTYSVVTGYNNNNLGGMSAIFGQGQTNSGNESLLAGNGNINNGNYNALFGVSNTASGTHSLIAGSSNVQTGGARAFMLASNSTSTKDMSFTTGNTQINNGSRSAMFNASNENNAEYGFTAGYQNKNNSYMSAIFGRYAEDQLASDPANWVATNSLLSVGIGSSDVSRKNALTVLKSGNVGIGTSTPVYRLDVYDTSTAFAQTRVSGGGSGGGILTRLQNDGGKEYVIGVGGSNNNTLGTDAFFIRDGNSFVNRLVIASSTGNVGIGNFTSAMPTAQLHTTGSVRFQTFGAGTLTTDASGNVTVSSDERLKEIQGDYTRGLEDLRKIKPISYKWNELSGLERESTYSGFSAQNVQSAIPEAVSTDPRGYLSLQERPILAALVNAIKEIAERLDKFVEVVNTKLIQTDKLCIGSTCVDEAKLQEMLNNQNIAPVAAPAPTPAPATTPTTSTSDATTTTNPVDATGAPVNSDPLVNWSDPTATTTDTTTPSADTTTTTDAPVTTDATPITTEPAVADPVVADPAPVVTDAPAQ